MGKKVSQGNASDSCPGDVQMIPTLLNTFRKLRSLRWTAFLVGALLFPASSGLAVTNDAPKASDGSAPNAEALPDRMSAPQPKLKTQPATRSSTSRSGAIPGSLFSSAPFAAQLESSYQSELTPNSPGFANFDINMTYRPFGSAVHALSLQAGYQHLLAEFKESYEPQGSFNDTTVGYMWSGIDTGKTSHFLLGSNVRLPSSPTSQDASLRGGIGVNAIYTSLIYGRWSGVMTYGLGLNSHRYSETEAGDLNVQWFQVVGLGLPVLITSWLQFVPSASWYFGIHYDDSQMEVQSYSGRFNIGADPQWNAFVSYLTRDQLVSNNDLFDEVNSQFFVGLDFRI